MKTIMFVLAMAMVTSTSNAEWVSGYTRRDGTYVNSYQRTPPDGQRFNNYGVGSGSGLSRDRDHDGIPNYRDRDDNNDGRNDDYPRLKY